MLKPARSPSAAWAASPAFVDSRSASVPVVSGPPWSSPNAADRQHRDAAEQHRDAMTKDEATPRREHPLWISISRSMTVMAFVSTSAAARLSRVRQFLVERGKAADVVLVGPSKDALADLARGLGEGARRDLRVAARHVRAARGHSRGSVVGRESGSCRSALSASRRCARGSSIAPSRRGELERLAPIADFPGLPEGARANASKRCASRASIRRASFDQRRRRRGAAHAELRRAPRRGEARRSRRRPRRRARTRDRPGAARAPRSTHGDPRRAARLRARGRAPRGRPRAREGRARDGGRG